MKKYIIIVCLHLLCSTLSARQSAVTYTFSGGRLGDDLLAFLHAEWISYTCDIPLLYKPMRYSEQFAVHDLRTHYNDDLARQFNQTVELKKNEFLKFDKDAGILYVIPYFPESMEEYRIEEFDPFAGGVKSKKYPYFAIDWEDKIFVKRVRQLLAPRTNLNLIVPPQDCVTVAIHVRKNSGGFDLPLLNSISEKDFDPKIVYVDRVFPLKHPADEYYINQIKFIAHLFNDKKVYIFIFTDDPNPERIVDLYTRSVAAPHVTFDYRKTVNNHYTNVVEDFFSMMNFDCFIRPDSNLSIVASRLGNFKVVIWPISHRWDGTKLTIDRVSVLIRK